MVCNFREIQFHTLCNDRFDHNTVVLDARLSICKRSAFTKWRATENEKGTRISAKRLALSCVGVTRS